MAISSAFKIAKIAAIAGASSLVNRDWSRRYLLNALTTGGPGLGPKFAQFLSMKMDLDAESSTPPAMTLDFVRSLISVYSPELDQAIASIEERGIVASIGQVHRAKLKDGREVAIKVQRPGVREALDSELDAMFAAARISPLAKRSFDFDRWKVELKNQLNLELDYSAEAQRQKEFRKYLSNMKQVIVPEVLDEYSSRELLVQIWEESSLLVTARQLPTQVRKHAMDLLVHSIFQALFFHQHIHADLQPANLGFRLNGGTSSENIWLVFYDFGATLRLSATEVGAITGLLTDAANKRFDRSGNWFAALGFDATSLAKLGPRLDRLTEALLAPIASRQALDPKEYQLSQRLGQILEDERWVFRTAGPPWFLVLMRIFFGTLHAAKDLDIQVRFGEILQVYLPLQFRTMQAALDSIKDLDQNLRPESVAASGRSAEFLCVAVRRGNELVVSLQLPASAVENLHDLVPESTAEEMARRGQDLRSIAQMALDSGLRPQELFRDETGEKTYHVWLE
jgi:predicted unusual protein kinase regulating ubiquinone biosynthesis (AarF/ABC1/UbiB family)